MNYYQLLQVSNDFDDKQLKRAYFSAIKKYTPEHDPEMFMQVKKAYDTLSNADMRAQYDMVCDLSDSERRILERIDSLIKSDYIDSALKELESICKKTTQPAFKLKLAELYADNGNTGKSVKLYEQLARTEKDNMKLAAMLALAYYRRGWVKKAEQQFANVLKSAGDNPEVLSIYIDYICQADANNKDNLNVIDNAIAMCDSKNYDIGELILKRFYYNAITTGSKNLSSDIEFLKKKISESKGFLIKTNEFLENILDNVLEENSLAPVHIGLIHFCLKFLPEKNMFSHSCVIEISDEAASEFISMGFNEHLPESLNKYFYSVCFPDKEIPLAMLLELELLEKRPKFLPAVTMLKEKYPNVYSVCADFFDRFVDERKYNYLLEKRKKHFGSRASDFLSMIFNNFDINDDNLAEALEEAIEDEYLNDDFDDFFLSQQPFVREEPKVGRNDPCPCGSGKKYKKCCGK